jgi:mannitol/fructose-specific phosphotransferase system IIA component (Ntr-type)
VITTDPPSFTALIDSRWIKPELQSVDMGLAAWELTVLLRSHPSVNDATRLERDVRRCLEREPIALRPGLIFPHVRSAAVADFVLVAGRSPRGICVAGNPAPIQLVFMLASPVAEVSGHLALIASLARHLAQPGMMERLIAAEEAGRFAQTLHAGG